MPAVEENILSMLDKGVRYVLFISYTFTKIDFLIDNVSREVYIKK